MYDHVSPQRTMKTLLKAKICSGSGIKNMFKMKSLLMTILVICNYLRIAILNNTLCRQTVK